MCGISYTKISHCMFSHTNRFTALDLAMLNAHTECAEYLIAQGATSGGGKFHRAALTIQTVWKFHRHKVINIVGEGLYNNWLS